MLRSLTFALIVILALAAAHAVPVSGVVTGPDGKPVPGARVVIRSFMTDDGISLTTDTAGQFAADVEPHPAIKSLGRLTVFVPGCALFGRELNVGENDVRLQQGHILTGKVVDEQGKPVAGASVIARNFAKSSMEGLSVSVPECLKDAFTATTAGDGVFHMPNLPTIGEARLELADPRFVSVEAVFSLKDDVTVPTPLIARPGATITGRATYEDGKPAAGIRVYASLADDHRHRMDGGNYAICLTDDDGTFRLTGLATDRYHISLFQRPQQWTAEAINNIEITEGQITAVKDLVLISGAVIEGVITEKDTGLPIRGIYVHAEGIAPASMGDGGTTDKDGHYAMRVPAGKYMVVIQKSVPGYCIPNEGIRTTVTVADREIKLVSQQLDKGLALSGKVIDEQGNSVADVPLEISVLCGKCGDEGCWHDSTASGSSAADGTFTLSGLSPGKARMATSLYDEPGDWSIIRGALIQVPPEKPVTLVVRKIAYQTLTGYMTTTDGAPLAGGKVKVEISLPLEGGRGIGHLSEVLSDAEGQVIIPRVHPDATITLLSAERTGYQYVSGGKVTKEGGVFRMQEIVFAQLGSKLTGVVVDAKGQRVAGAQVISPGLPEKVSTDAQGRFTLKNLPKGELWVLAVSGRACGRLRAMPDAQPITITITEPTQPKPQDVERGAALVERLWNESQGKPYYARDYLPLTLQRVAPERAAKMGGTPNQPNENTLAAAIDEAAKRDPAHIEEWVPKLAQIKTPFMKIMATAIIAQTVVDTNPTLAADLYKAIKGAGRQDGPEQLYADLSLIRLAIKLKNGEADTLFTQLMAAVQQHWEQENGLGEMVAEALIEYSPELARKAADALPAEERDGAYVRMIQTIAPKDVKLARQLLGEMETMGAAQWVYGLAVKAVVSAIRKDDPAGVLALARKVTGDSRAAALALVAEVSERATALPLFREAVGETSDITAKVRYAVLATAVDPGVGRELFDLCRKEMADNANSQNMGLASFAFYYSSVDPAESRLLLENEYAHRLLAATGDGYPLTDLILAMTPLDVDRALEMAQALSDENAHFDTQRKIAQYILATEEVRRTLHFDRWGASDTWTPGDETGW